MTIQDNPYDVYFDIESTDIKNNGGIMEVAAIRVHRATGQIVGKYYSPTQVPVNCNKNEYGQKHYEKVKVKCQNALPPEYVFPEFLDWMRGPRNLTYPRLVGYCIEDRDLPNLISQLGAEKEWIANVEILDIAHKYAYRLYPDPRYTPGSMQRSLVNVALDLGVKVDKSKVHDPEYDCELCIKVLPLLEAKMNNAEMQKAPESKEHKQETLDLGNESNKDSIETDITQTLKGFTDMYPATGVKGKKRGPMNPYGKSNTVADECAGRTLDRMQIDFLVRETRDGKLNLTCPRCKETDESGNIVPARMFIRESGNTPKTDPDHFFFGCTNYFKEDVTCKASCNMDGTKQADHHFDPKYANVRKSIFKYLDDHQTEYEAFKAAREALKLQ